MLRIGNLQWMSIESGSALSSLFLRLCLGLFLALAFYSCKKKEELTNAPVIEFTGITPSTATEYVHSITISFTYEDLNGDIGENDASATNLFITDSRNGVTYNYRIKELSPPGSDIHIKGTLNAILKNTAITDGSSSQSVTYSVYITDRAGNSSNTISTSAITVVK